MAIGLTMLVAGAIQAAPCALEGVPATFDHDQRVTCGWVSVPLNHTSGKTIRLWTARIHADNPSPAKDAILYINGGPGVATVDSILPGLPTGKSFPTLRKDRDIILFDQRGSGRSEEALCPTLLKTLNDISKKALSPQAEDDESRAAFVACRQEAERAGQHLTDYSTRQTVADIEALRQAFGYSQWNLHSISYGSLVALDAMRTHPATIRAAILNSPYPPNSVTWAEQVSSAAAGYQMIDRACAAQPACRARFGALVPKLEETLARLEREPIRDGGNLITGRQFAKALWPLAVRSASVRFVPLAIERAHAGDTKLISKLVSRFAGGDAFGGWSPAQAQAISCYESGRTADWYQRARALYPNLTPSTPDDGWDRLCAAFRPGFADPSFFAPVASAIPTLIFAGSLDLATPVVDAYQAMRFLTNATLVEVPGAAHGPMSLNDCTRGIGAAFLSRPEDKPDISCVAKQPYPEFATDGLDELLAT